MNSLDYTFDFHFLFFHPSKMTFENIKSKLEHHLSTFVGYPCNTAYDYSDVTSFFNIHINNVGCPFSSGTYKANTKEIEQEVLAWFARLWGIDKSKMWGVITNGGTESSLQGLYIARESSNGRPVVFLTSEHSHYSIFKISRILGLDIQVVKCQENGEMDYSDFDRIVGMHREKYIIVNANIGTTMTGATDNTREIYRILKKYGKGGSQDYYIHADAALSGFFLPFLEKDILFKGHINSMSISLHKFLGLPYPAGIFMIEKRFLRFIENSVEYVGSVDATISGSRNGHTPLMISHIIEKIGYDGFRTDIERCIELADYLTEILPGAWRNQNSITVVFPRPSGDIVNKWQLATQGNISHVITMPHVTREKLNDFVADYLGQMPGESQI